MLLYIHGFNSSGNATKANILKEHFGLDKVIAPTLPLEPNKAINLIEGILAELEELPIIVGSSLGAFYTTYILCKYNVNAFLINPSTQPWLTLPKVDPEYPVEYQNQLKEIARQSNNFRTDNTTVILAKDDELLDYRIAAEKYKECRLVVNEGGGHKCLNFEVFLGLIGD